MNLADLRVIIFYNQNPDDIPNIMKVDMLVVLRSWERIFIKRYDPKSLCSLKTARAEGWKIVLSYLLHLVKPVQKPFGKK